MEATLIFPHQLFEQHPAIAIYRRIFLIEEALFFQQYNFHKAKLVFHRATMQFYYDYLNKNGYRVQYIDTNSHLSKIDGLIAFLSNNGYTKIHFAEVADDWLEKHITKASTFYNIAIVEYKTPAFINELNTAAAFLSDKKRYFQTDFYIWQRKMWQLLLDENQKPIGGKWTYDAENRQKLPINVQVPNVNLPSTNAYVLEARKYIECHFPNNIGNADSIFGQPNAFYPITFDEAQNWLEKFLVERFSLFGIYEDAMAMNQPLLFHSCLTPLLNSGLLTPLQIINAVQHFANNHTIPLNSFEGFIRQIIGWREFIRIVYHLEGGKQRTTNYWKFNRKIPPQFYSATTGIQPIDDCIKKVLDNAYNHHIERLMILGNFMLLCEFDPNEVYQWFMELYIDAYDWVMVPNVYGMTQFADGGLMTTKPYISGSKYIMKMSNYPKGHWQATWDGLFWRFMHVHRQFFLQNPRLGMLIKTFDKMSESTRLAHLENADYFLQKLDNWLLENSKQPVSK